jgi:hypothetical protein
MRRTLVYDNALSPSWSAQDGALHPSEGAYFNPNYGNVWLIITLSLGIYIHLKKM